MLIEFTKILYSNSNGFLTLVCKNDKESRSFGFIDNEFKFVFNSEVADLNLVDYNFVKTNYAGTSNRILGVKQNDDFDYILSINDNAFLKIFYFPDNSQPNGVIQTFAIYQPNSPTFISIAEDYNEGVNVEIVRSGG